MNSKMSFRTFLLNENSSTDNKPYLIINTGFWTSDFNESEFSNTFNKSNFSIWITDKFIDYFNDTSIDIYFDEVDELVITIDLDYNLLDDNNIQQYSNKLAKYYEQFTNMSMPRNFIDGVLLVFREQIPKGVSTEWKRIMFTGYNSTETFTLEGIDKQIPKAEAIMLYHAGNVITGNVLGLLKLKSLKTIWNYPSMSIKWLDIVNKHFVSKDIIACQEELIDNGLKDFAEL